MEYKKIAACSSIRTAIFLELAGVTVWKVSSYFSQVTAVWIYVALIAVMAGFYKFYGSATRLLESYSSYADEMWESVSSKFAVLVTIGAFVLAIAFLLFGLSDISKLTQPIMRGSGDAITFTVVSVCTAVGAYGSLGMFIRCIPKAADARNIWRPYIWLLFIAGFTYILLVFTGDSRSTPAANAVISVIFISAHWYLGSLLLRILMQLECGAVREGERLLPGSRPWERLTGIAIAVLLVFSGAAAVARFSFEKDFICCPYGNGVILGEYTGSLSRVKIPERINGKEVLGLGGSFKDNKAIRAVELPDSLKILGDGTFDGCTGLDQIVLPRNLEYIGEGCFAYSNLTTLDQNGSDVKNVGRWAFDETPWYDAQKKNGDMCLIGGNLIYYNIVGESVHLPEGPRVIQQGALADNAGGDGDLGVRELYLPDSLEVLGDRALGDLHNLTDLHIPETVGSVSDYAINGSGDHLVIWCKKGSAAEAMAEWRGFRHCEEGQPRPSVTHFGDISAYRNEGQVYITCPREEAGSVRGVLGKEYLVIQRNTPGMYKERLADGFDEPKAADIQVLSLRTGAVRATYHIEALQRLLKERGALEGGSYELKTGIVEGCYRQWDKNYIYLSLKQEDQFLVIDVDSNRLNIVGYGELADAVFTDGQYQGMEVQLEDGTDNGGQLTLVYGP